MNGEAHRTDSIDLVSHGTYRMLYKKTEIEKNSYPCRLSYYVPTPYKARTRSFQQTMQIISCGYLLIPVLCVRTTDPYQIDSREGVPAENTDVTNPPPPEFSFGCRNV